MGSTDRLSRRDFLKLAGIGAGAAVLVSCRPSATATPAPTVAAKRQATATAEPPATAQPVGITWWEYPLWTGITGEETKGLSQDDPKRAEYSELDWPTWVAEQFAQQYPGFSCKTELITWDEGRQKLTMAATTGGGRPHLFLEDGPVILRFVKKGAMLPVELSQAEKDDFFPGAVSAGSSEGKVWYRPWVGGSRFVVVNRAIFRERGVEDLVPTEGDRLWSYEEFLEAAKATTFTRSNGEQVFGHANAFGANSWPHYWADGYFWGSGGRIFDDDGVTVVLDTPETARGLQFVADMANKHNVLPTGSAGLSRGDMRSMFWQGRLASIVESHSFGMKTINAVEDGTIPNPDLVDVYPVMFPADLPEHKPGIYTVVMGFGQFDTGTPEERAACAKFIEFLTNEENSKAIVRASALPCRKSAQDVFEDNPYMSYAMQALNYGHPDTLSPYFDPVTSWIDAMWQAVVSGERTVKEALQEAHQGCAEYIAEEEAKTAG